MSVDRSAQWEKLLRAKLAAIRDEAMELQAALEFAHRDDVTQDVAWNFAAATVRDAERLIANQNGELSEPE